MVSVLWRYARGVLVTSMRRTLALLALAADQRRGKAPFSLALTSFLILVG